MSFLNKNADAILTMASAFLFYLSFPNNITPFGYWICTWLFAIPLFFVLKDSNLARRFWVGLLFGLLFYAAFLSWIIPYNPAGYVLFVVFLSVQPILFSLLYQSQSKNKLLQLLYVPSVWVASEYLRNSLLIKMGVSWNIIALSQTFNIYAIQISALVGAAGVSFVLILVNYCLYKIIRKKEECVFYGTVILVTILLVYGYGYLSIKLNEIKDISRPALKIAAIQPNITARKTSLTKLDVNGFIDQQKALTEKALQDHSYDLVIWPETAVPFFFSQDESIRNKIKRIAVRTQSYLLVGVDLFKGSDRYNSAILLDSRAELLGTYNKRILVPFSEYMPEGRGWDFLKKNLKIRDYDFRAGDKLGIFKGKTQNNLDYKFGVAICSEDNISSVFRDSVKAGAGFMVILISDVWFNQSAALIIHAQNSILHAVENRVPVVRATNTGWSCHIDKYGRISHLPGERIPQLNSADYSISLVRPNYEKSLYNFLGDAFSLLCCFYAILYLLVKFFQKQRIKNS